VGLNIDAERKDKALIEAQRAIDRLTAPLAKAA
jgi:hypothetical protein